MRNFKNNNSNFIPGKSSAVVHNTESSAEGR